MAVDEGETQGERLRHAHQCVIDRAVAVGVVLAHDVANDSGALDVAAVWPQTHLGHLEQDPSLHRLEAIACIGQRAGVDDGIGVLQERTAHLVADIDVDDVLRNGRWGW